MRNWPRRDVGGWWMIEDCRRPPQESLSARHRSAGLRRWALSPDTMAERCLAQTRGGQSSRRVHGISLAGCLDNRDDSLAPCCGDFSAQYVQCGRCCGRESVCPTLRSGDWGCKRPGLPRISLRRLAPIVGSRCRHEDGCCLTSCVALTSRRRKCARR